MNTTKILLLLVLSLSLGCTSANLLSEGFQTAIDPYVAMSEKEKAEVKGMMEKLKTEYAYGNVGRVTRFFTIHRTEDGYSANFVVAVRDYDGNYNLRGIRRVTTKTFREIATIASNNSTFSLERIVKSRMFCKLASPSSLVYLSSSSVCGASGAP